MIIFLQGWERNIVLDRLREEIVSRERERERESAFVREGRENGLEAAFLIDGSRDFYLAHRPGQKLRGSPASFSLRSLRFTSISLVAPRSHDHSIFLPPRFTGARTPPLPPVRLVPLPVEERSFEGRARRMQKRERKEKKRGSKEPSGGGWGRGEGGDGGDGWGEARGKGGGKGEDRETPKAALTPLRSARDQNRGQNNAAFSEEAPQPFSLDNRTLYRRHYPPYLPSSLRYLFVITLELFYADIR